MKPFIKLSIVASVLLLASCGNHADTTTNDDTTTVQVDETPLFRLNQPFPQLASYLHSQDSSFSAEKFEGGELQTQDTIRAEPIDPEQLDPYRPYLVYNTDSTMAIDLVSYNYVITQKNGKTVIEHGGPDTEVALLDLKKNTRKRILFLGSAGTVLQAKWEDANTIAIAGAEDIEDEKIRPSVWRYSLATGKMELYQYMDTITADIKNYSEQNLNQ